MDNSQNNIGYFPQMLICDKHSSVELNSDFTLPDYQPEIRRLLTSRAVILPQSEFLGNGNAEIQGDINYKITYLGADGSVYCATLSDKYGLTASLDFTSHSVNSDDIALIPSCKVENIGTRVLGPRKLNIRAKLDCRVLGFSPSLYSPNLVGAHNKSTIENRIFETTCINIKRSESKSLILNDFISLDTSSDNIRIIDCYSNVIFNECSAANDKIYVKGESVLKILYCNEGENTHPLSMIKKIPFSCEMYASGVTSLFECTARGVCFDERFDFSENGVAVDITLSLSAIAQRNESVKYISDAYSTEKLCQNSNSELSILNTVRCCCGNLTQNDVFSLEDINLSRDVKIIDIIGKSNINELAIENGKLIFKGSNDYQVVYALEEEYSSLTINAPIKYELDTRSAINVEKDFKWQVESNVSSVRARHDGERLFVDCELNLNVILNCLNKLELLNEMIFGEYLKKPCGEILLCYPDKDATVWSVAKQYGEPQKNIRTKNSISETEEQIKKRYLII